MPRMGNSRSVEYLKMAFSSTMFLWLLFGALVIGCQPRNCSEGEFDLSRSPSFNGSTVDAAGNATAECAPCHSLCKECFDPDQVDCYACEGVFLVSNIRREGRDVVSCLSACPDGYSAAAGLSARCTPVPFPPTASQGLDQGDVAGLAIGLLLCSAAALAGLFAGKLLWDRWRNGKQGRADFEEYIDGHGGGQRTDDTRPSISQSNVLALNGGPKEKEEEEGEAPERRESLSMNLSRRFSSHKSSRANSTVLDDCIVINQTALEHEQLDGYMKMGLVKTDSEEDYMNMGQVKTDSEEDYMKMGHVKSAPEEDYMNMGQVKSAPEDYIKMGLVKSAPEEDYIKMGLVKSEPEDYIKMGLVKSGPEEDYIKMGLVKSAPEEDYIKMGLVKSEPEDYIKMGRVKSGPEEDYIKMGGVNSQSAVGKDQPGSWHEPLPRDRGSSVVSNKSSTLPRQRKSSILDSRYARPSSVLRHGSFSGPLYDSVQHPPTPPPLAADGYERVKNPASGRRPSDRESALYAYASTDQLRWPGSDDGNYVDIGGGLRSPVARPPSHHHYEKAPGLSLEPVPAPCLKTPPQQEQEQEQKQEEEERKEQEHTYYNTHAGTQSHTAGTP